ncbi:hypothetical protein [Nesterenkonia pannonica]|uniref:hypothetical protein n=1 Tax=Nesterenkonia pannonica TaxID=1548602 RepID=UPI0021649CDC|nr:hypothetical protein [Nesterenkonia pannonica]
MALMSLGFWLSTRRDLGASLMHTRPGRPEASAALGTPAGIAARTLRGTLRGWAIALVITGLMYGGFAQTMLDTADDL